MADEKIPKKKKTIKKAVKPKKKKWAVDDPDKPLTTKQKIFVMNYIANLGNGAKAVRDAEFNIKNPYQYASELLIKPNIQRFYNEEFNKAFEETGFMVKQSIQNIARMANSNILDFYNPESGGIDPLIKDSGREETKVIQSIESETKVSEEPGDENTPSGKKLILFKKEKIKMYDALKANEIILKMAGKFADKEGNRKTENIEDKMSDFINTLEKKELE